MSSASKCCVKSQKRVLRVPGAPKELVEIVRKARARHGLNHRALRLRPLGDFHALVSRGVAWSRVETIANEVMRRLDAKRT